MFSFSAAAKDDLDLPPGVDGFVWQHQPRKLMSQPHHHDELEVNLVVSGRASYLLGDRRYALRRDT